MFSAVSSFSLPQRAQRGRQRASVDDSVSGHWHRHSLLLGRVVCPAELPTGAREYFRTADHWLERNSGRWHRASRRGETDGWVNTKDWDRLVLYML